MTREEAIAKVSKVNVTHKDYESETVFAVLDTLVALGLLKLEEKKSAHDRMMEACRRRELTGATIDRFCEALDLAGLRVVEKQHGE